MMELVDDGVLMETKKGLFLIPFGNIRHIEYGKDEECQAIAA